MADAKDSGKSLLGQFIANSFSAGAAQSIDVDHLGGQFALAGIEQARLLSCLEMNTDRLNKKAVTMLKRLTGESSIRSEAKRKNVRTVTNRAKIVLATNGGLLLPAGMEDNAFYRRVIVLPFIFSTPMSEIINDLDQRLEKERSAILSKAVRTLKQIIKPDGGILFPESDLSIRMKEKWMGMHNIDDEFYDCAFEFTGDPKHRIVINDIEKVYRFFAGVKRQADPSLMISNRAELIGKLSLKYGLGRQKEQRALTLKELSEEKRGVSVERKKRTVLCGVYWRQDFLREIGYDET